MIILNGKRIDSTVGDALPIGTLSPFVGLVAPKGYLLCQGQLVDKAKYPELWDLCGDTFGQSTTTQFYLPDLQNKVIGGYKPNDDIFGTFGASIGAKSVATGNHTLTAAESGLPSHYHTGWHWGTPGGSSFGVNNSGTGTWRVGYTSAASEANFYTGYTGGDAASSAHNHGNVTVVQPTIVLNWIIKASMLAVVTGNIEDSLTSTSNTDALSAKQGKVLNDKFDSYYTKNELEDELDGLIKVQEFSSSIGVLAGGAEFCNKTLSVAIPSGYKAIGIVGFGLAGSNYTRCYIDFLKISATGTVEYTVRNYSGDSTASMTLSIRVLLIKTV